MGASSGAAKRCVVAVLLIISLAGGTAYGAGVLPGTGSAGQPAEGRNSKAALNQAPADWPAEDLGAGGWVAYTQAGAPIRDQTGKEDCSTGGSRPAGAVEIASGDAPYLPSAYFAYNTDAGVFYYRIRLDAMPLTASAETAGTRTGGDPWGNVTYNLLIECDGDGYKEFTVVLDGDSGGGKNKDLSVPPAVNDGDDLKIYFNDLQSQCVAPEIVSNNTLSAPGDLVWWGNAGTKDAVVPQDPTADGAAWDFGRSRLVVHGASNATWGRGYFVDFQFPVDALTDAYNGGAGGARLVGPDTPMAFGYSTSNSNTDPLQKDYASNLCYTASCGERFPYMDFITLRDGLARAPKIGDMTLSEIDCHASVTVRVALADTLTVTGDMVDDTIAHVSFAYYPDSNGNGIEDDGGIWSNMAVVGGSMNPDTNGHLAPDGIGSSFNDWGVVWDTSSLAGGQYLVKVTAVDDTGYEASKIVGAYIVDASGSECRQGPEPTWASYADTSHAVPSDRFLNVAPGSTVYMHGIFAPLVHYNVAFYFGMGAQVGTVTPVSDSFGNLAGSLIASPSTPYGLYHSVVYPAGHAPPGEYDGVYDGSTNPIIADDTFRIYALTLLRNADVYQLSPQAPPSDQIFVAQYPARPALDLADDVEHPDFSSGVPFDHDTSDLSADASPLIFYELYGYSGNGLRVSKDLGKVVITYGQ